MTNKVKIFLGLISVMLLSTGCSQKDYFLQAGKKYGVNHRTLRAIAHHESGNKNNVVNVNRSIFNVQQGPHYFDNWFTANLYMDTVLDPLFLNYDIGICQINKMYLDKNNLDNEDLLDPEINIDMAAKIYKYNVRACKGNLRCALSMYNTGHKRSKIGFRYADKVIKIRKKYYSK